MHPPLSLPLLPPHPHRKLKQDHLDQEQHRRERCPPDLRYVQQPCLHKPSSLIKTWETRQKKPTRTVWVPSGNYFSSNVAAFYFSGNTVASTSVATLSQQQQQQQQPPELLTLPASRHLLITPTPHNTPIRDEHTDTKRTNTPIPRHTQAATPEAQTPRLKPANWSNMTMKQKSNWRQRMREGRRPF